MLTETKFLIVSIGQRTQGNRLEEREQKKTRHGSRPK